MSRGDMEAKLFLEMRNRLLHGEEMYNSDCSKEYYQRDGSRHCCIKANPDI